MKKSIPFFALVWLSFSAFAQNLQNEGNQKPYKNNESTFQTNETKPGDTIVNKSISSQLINIPQGWSGLSSYLIPAPLFTDAYTILLYNNFPEADHFRLWVGQGASVRCVKDE